jgi:hypothetical protein
VWPCWLRLADLLAWLGFWSVLRGEEEMEISLLRFPDVLQYCMQFHFLINTVGLFHLVLLLELVREKLN